MTGKRGQAAVEFGLTVGLLMLLVVVVAQLAILVHYRNSLLLATREGAFQAGLPGEPLSAGAAATRQMWHEVEPGGGDPEVTVTQQGNLVVVSASADAPALLPLPFAPFDRVPVSARSVHTIERFQPGSGA